MFQSVVVEKFETQVLYSIAFFPKIVLFMMIILKYMVAPDRPQMSIECGEKIRFVAVWPRQGHKHTLITLNSYSFSTVTNVTQTPHSRTVCVRSTCCVAHIKIKICESDRSVWFCRVLLCSHALQYISIPSVAYISSYDLVGRYSSVGITTRYGLDGPGIESR